MRIGWRMQELATFIEPELMFTESSWQGPGGEGWGLQGAFSEYILLTWHLFGHLKAKHEFVDYDSGITVEETTQKPDWGLMENWVR